MRPAILAALALALSACAHGPAGEKAASRELPRCDSCHVSGEPRLKSEVLPICRACHATAHGALNASDPGAGMACNSCHDPHAVHGVTGVPRM